MIEKTQGPEADFYVATNGNDAWSGALPAPNAAGTDGPFATLEQARDALRQLKAAEGLNTPVTVMVRGGTYYLATPVIFGPEDSGTEDCPIIYAAYPDEKPVFSGGKQITGWQRGEGELWTVEVPEVKAGQWYFRQLFVNGERRCRARLPREGYYEVPERGGTRGEAHKKQELQFNPGEIDPNWRNLEDVEVIVLQFWAESRLRIESIDEAANVVRFTERAFRPLDWCMGWYAENVYEGLAQPGDWYLDRRTGVLYYWPLPGENLDELAVIVPLARHWLRLEGDYEGGRLVEYLAFRGLTFQYTSWSLEEKLGYSYPQAAVEQTPGELLWPGYPAEDLSIPQSQIEVPAGIYAEGTHHIRLVDNKISRTGAWGIDLHAGCQDNKIVGNHIYDLGAGAIRVGDTDVTFNDAEESCRTTITDNHIHDGCQVYQGAAGIWLGQSGYNRIAHNEMHGAFEWAISVGWQWGYMPPSQARNNTIEYNHVHHIAGNYFNPHAAVYFLGISPGTVLRYNLIEHIGGDGGGICLDNSTAGVLIENNLVHHAEQGNLGFNFNTIGNIIQNNIFALGRARQWDRYGDLPWEGGKVDQSGILYRNIVYWKDSQLFRREDWDNFDIIFDYNLYWDASGEPIKFLKYSFQEWQQQGLDQNSIIADPLFVDPDSGDFTLRPESPAFNLGFKPFDLSTVGPRPHQIRE